MADGEIARELRIHEGIAGIEAIPQISFGVVLFLAFNVPRMGAEVLFGPILIPMIGMVLFMLIGARSYFKMRGLTRPKDVSKRRIRVLVYSSAFLGICWGTINIFAMPYANFENQVILLMFATFGAFAAIGVNSVNVALPFALILQVCTAIVSLWVGLLGHLFLSLLFVASSASVLFFVLRNRQDVIATIKLKLAGQQALQDQLEAEEKLRQSEAEAAKAEQERQAETAQTQRNMINAVPFPMVLTKGNEALEITPQAQAQFRLSKNEIKDFVLTDFFDDPAEQEKMIRILGEQGKLDDYEVLMHDTKGTQFWVTISMRPLVYDGEDCWLNSIYVIDARKRAEADLVEAKQRTENANKSLEAVSSQLAKYISPQLYRNIISGEQQVTVESQRKKLTIFFSDIAGFTEITDSLQSEELTTLLNQYLTEMSKIAQEYGANFDKFIGDAIVLYFGDPETKGTKEDATECVKMAIAMQRRMRELQSEWRDLGLEKPFELRIGINTGYCTVGNFGSEDRMDYTIIGGEVNLAARLEAHSEVGGILLANETYSLVKDWLMAEKGETITVKGFAKPITTYRVKGIYEDLVSEGRIIHQDQHGLTLTIDREKLTKTSKSKAIKVLENALAELADQGEL